ncbi:hypothetical protein [Lampropedia aestuarii]|uniref:portal protein n=1 Tax=Lampropedia aestuarii TaxID=2562762 RepID=UPI002468271F|nr:hypothetical protein [Lampropedia aestuarii]MDH5857792.1 hypothetical protein [Lampropedia aestuarii]
MDTTDNINSVVDEVRDGADEPLTLQEFQSIVREAINQPPWRAQADREADYADGNQLDSDLLRRQKALGIPPAKENKITPAIRAVCGYEAKTRTDWRVTSDGDPGGQDVADALNYRLNQAERHAKADRALSEAFKSMIVTGVGWVEVAIAQNSIQFPYKCRHVHRNEVFWDMHAQEPDLSDARWLYRRRWVERQRAAQLFPEHAPIILRSLEKWIAGHAGEMLEGDLSTGLLNATNAERAWTATEDSWYNDENETIAITEVWYRRWVRTTILRMPDGRAVEYDQANELHQVAVATGRGRLVEELMGRVRQAFWMGPHQLVDRPSPYPHCHFPYVPVWGYREDMTGVPYGLVRDMIFPQDNLNSSISKLRWGMSATRTERTKGAVAMSDEQFRRQVSRVDADIVLDDQHMAKQGARFEVKRDFQLNDQQFQLMQDSRQSIEGVSGITPAFQGQKGTARSGLQEQTQLEQSEISIADLMDGFKDARTQVGELLMALIIADMGKEETTIVIEGDVLNPPRTVVINAPEVDPHTGVAYRSNDIKRTRLKVALEDVPSSSGFRAQQLNSLSESIKSLPAQMQQVMMPFMIDLMDLPRKKQVVEAIQQASGQADPEQMREQVKQELMYELKERELALREREVTAREGLIAAQRVQTGVQASYSAMQAGAQIAQMPMIAPIADEVMRGAGYQRPDPMGDDPDFPVPTDLPPSPGGDQGGAAADVPQNTSPAFPPVPQQAEQGMNGIETQAITDNI